MATPDNYVDLDIQFVSNHFSARVHSSTTNTLRAYLYENSQKFQPITGQTAVMAYTTGYEINNSPSTITGVISTTSNYVEFVLDSFTERADYYVQVAVQDGSSQWVFGDGTLHISKKLSGL